MNLAAAKTQFNWRRIGWVAAIAIGIIGLALYFNPLALIHRRSHRFFTKVEQSINPEELRSWAAELVNKQAFGTKPKVSELPSNLLKLSAQPPSVSICSTNARSDQPYLMLIYGGGFYHWGIDIGPTNFVRANDPAFTTIKWASGIYFRHEGSD